MSLKELGFATFEDLFSPAECDSLTERLSSLPAGKAGSRCLLDEPWCRTAAATLRERLARRLPHDEGRALADSVAIQCTYFHKSPEKNWLVSWHQDRSVPVAETAAAELAAANYPGFSRKEGFAFVHAPDELLDRMLAVRLHLDDSTPHNGPLRVIAGSHAHGTLSSESIERLCLNDGETLCPVSRGGVLLMRPLLLHASSKSTSMEPRRVLHFLFAPAQPSLPLSWWRTA